MEYTLHIVIIIAIYAILALSLDLLVGYLGILSVSHFSFLAIGAYTLALMTTTTSAAYFPSMLVALLIAGVIGFIVGLPALKVSNDYLVLVTLAFQGIMFGVLNNWESLTNGPLGISGIPQPEFGGWVANTRARFLALAALLLGFVLVVRTLLVRSPFGRVLCCIREDEIFATTAGKTVGTFKLIVFIFSGCIASLGGVLYASYITFIDPASFTLMDSIFILSIVIIGGTASTFGPIVGTIFLVLLGEGIRFVGLPDANAANLLQMLYAFILIGMLLLRPKGLLGRFDLSETSDATSERD